MAEEAMTAIQKMFRWAAIHLGIRYPVISTIFVAAIAAVLWIWFFKAHSEEEAKSPSITTGPATANGTGAIANTAPYSHIDSHVQIPANPDQKQE